MKSSTPRTSTKAQVAVKAFEIDYAAKYPKAVAKITADPDVLLEFHQYPAEHWVHLRTTNPIDRLLPRCAYGPKSPKDPVHAAGIAMAYKLIEAAQARWRMVNAPQLVALVRAGALFHKGKLLARTHRHHTGRTSCIPAKPTSPEKGADVGSCDAGATLALMPDPDTRIRTPGATRDPTLNPMSVTLVAPVELRLLGQRIAGGEKPTPVPSMPR